MESREQQLINNIEDAINVYGFDVKKAAQLITEMHRTNQQSFWRFIRAAIVVYGSEDYKTDPRNAAAHEDAAAMLTYLKENGRYIPMV